jgi:hypothetical protein
MGYNFGSNRKPGGKVMAAMTQKKISISSEQQKFLENYRLWGFTDQSSIVREALARYMSEVKTDRRKLQLARKAKELASEYETDSELTPFTDLDAEDFL